MGVHGLWQVLEPTGRPVPFQSLKGKVLAVDVSIWLHQVVKGFRDKDGNPLPNAHLLGVFYRVCKLLHYGIKPVFVFDGGVPILKRQTMMQRKKRKIEAMDKADVSRRKILSNFLQQQLHRNVRHILNGREVADCEESADDPQEGPSQRSPPKKKAKSGSSPKKSYEQGKDAFHEALEAFREKFKAEEDSNNPTTRVLKNLEDTSDSSEEEEEESNRGYYGMDYAENFSAIVSNDFDALPLETQHEILFEMQESRKMNSWGKVEKMPQDLGDFSSFQMDRLVKRRFLQKKIQTVQKEMGQRHIHVQNLDDLLKMEYDLEGETQEVVGSQEQGCVLLKKKNKTLKEDQDIQKPNSTPQVKGADKIFDESWNDSEDEMMTSSSEDEPFLENDKEDGVITSDETKQLTEEEELSLAIARSLEDSQTNSKVSNSNDPAYSTESPEGATSNLNYNYDQQQKTQESPSKSTLPVLSNVSQAQLASCSKFLDTIGFSSKIVSSQAQTNFNTSVQSSNVNEIHVEKLQTINKNDDSSSGSDFEDVDNDSSNDDSSDFKSSNVAAVISFDQVIKAPLEDDIFADVFNEEPIAKEITNEPTAAAISSEDKDESLEVKQDCEWDSDPDTSSLNDKELAVYCGKASTGDPIREASKEQEVESTKSPALEDSEDSGSNSIARTLGKRSGQNSSESRGVKMITVEYMQAQEKLNTEQGKLQSERGFQERVATSITDQMNIETQELISLFGIPYIISPMEAESQCAFLDAACLTEGTITDDSDVWLFGGQRVYKNFYSQADRHLEFYQLADIAKILNLDRDKLVLIAMISGGDYSEGIDGCGPVSALELLAEFPTNSIEAYDALVQFREWWDMAQLQQAPLDSKIRQKLKKLKLKPGFPNRAVYDAYMNPTIDSSTEQFHWGTPDLDSLRSYTKTKFGWDQKKCDGMLLPVMKSLRCQADEAKQQTLDRFVVHGLKPSLKFGKSKKTGSKRLNSALKKLKTAFPPSGNLQLSSDSGSTSSEDEEKPEAIVATPKATASTSSQLPSSINKLSFSELKPSSSSQSSDLEVSDVTSKNSKEERYTKATRKIQNIIPQKVQAETIKKMNKHKAIEIFKNKKS